MVSDPAKRILYHTRSKYIIRFIVYHIAFAIYHIAKAIYHCKKPRAVPCMSLLPLSLTTDHSLLTANC